MTHGFERPVKVSNIIQPIKSRVGIETILFSLHHLPASKELDIAFSCIKKKILQVSWTVEGHEGRVEKSILGQSIFVFLHMTVCVSLFQSI